MFTAPKSALLISALLALTAHADTRLNTIKQRAELRIGYVVDDFPFNYELNGQPTGYGIELSKLIADKITYQQKLPELKLIFQPITLQNRFDLVNNGQVDIACGAHSNTVERKKIVNFSHNYFLARSRLLVNQQSGINSYGDLQGKRIGVTKGSLGESVLRQRKHKFKYQTLNPYPSYEPMIASLLNGENEAAIGDDVLLKSLLAIQGDAASWKFVGPAVTLDRYACILPHQQNDFKAAIDGALATLSVTGELEKLFNRWFQEEIESPKGKVNLNFEFSVAMQSLYSRPTDTAVGE